MFCRRLPVHSLLWPIVAIESIIEQQSLFKNSISQLFYRLSWCYTSLKNSIVCAGVFFVKLHFCHCNTIVWFLMKNNVHTFVINLNIFNLSRKNYLSWVATSKSNPDTKLKVALMRLQILRSKDLSGNQTQRKCSQ